MPMLWDLSHKAKSLPKKETKKPIPKKPEKTNSSVENGIDFVLERPRKVGEPVLKKKVKKEVESGKIGKRFKKSSSANASVLDCEDLPSVNPNHEKSEKKKKHEKKESFAERRKRLDLERLKAEARSNYHKVMPEPLKPFKPFSRRKRGLDNEPSVYECVMDERRAEGRGYSGAR